MTAHIPPSAYPQKKKQETPKPHEETVLDRLAPQLKSRTQASDIKWKAEQELKKLQEQLEKTRDKFIPSKDKKEDAARLEEDIEPFKKDTKNIEDIKKQASERVANEARDTLLAHILDIQTKTKIQGEKGVLNFERRSGLYTGIKKEGGAYKHGESDTNIRELFKLIKNEWKESENSNYQGLTGKLDRALNEKNIHEYLETQYKSLEKVNRTDSPNQNRLNIANARLENIKAFLKELGADVGPEVEVEYDPTPVAKPEKEEHNECKQVAVNQDQDTSSTAPDVTLEVDELTELNKSIANIQTALIKRSSASESTTISIPGYANTPAEAKNALDPNSLGLTETDTQPYTDIDLPSISTMDYHSLSALSTKLDNLITRLKDKDNALITDITNLKTKVDSLIKELLQKELKKLTKPFEDFATGVKNTAESITTGVNNLLSSINPFNNN